MIPLFSKFRLGLGCAGAQLWQLKSLGSAASNGLQLRLDWYHTPLIGKQTVSRRFAICLHKKAFQMLLNREHISTYSVNLWTNSIVTGLLCRKCLASCSGTKKKSEESTFSWNALALLPSLNLFICSRCTVDDV